MMCPKKLTKRIYIQSKSNQATMGNHAKYHAVPEDENVDSPSKLGVSRKSRYFITIISLIVATLFLSGLPCFFLGKYTERKNIEHDWFCKVL